MCKESFFGRDQSHVCNASLTSSSLANLHPRKVYFSGPNMW